MKLSKTDQTRALIIEKAAPLFNTKGFVGTSLSDMERATGLTKGSIYNNFVNKDEVALAVFDHNLQIVNNLIVAEMARFDTAKDQLLAYAQIYSKDFPKAPFPEGGCPILNTAIEADDTHPELRKRASEAVLSWTDKITSLIKKGIKNQEFRADINAEEVAVTILAMIEGGIMISKVTGQLSHLRSVIRSVEKLIQDLV